jgi:hypothetical protein
MTNHRRAIFGRDRRHSLAGPRRRGNIGAVDVTTSMGEKHQLLSDQHYVRPLVLDPSRPCHQQVRGESRVAGQMVIENVEVAPTRALGVRQCCGSLSGQHVDVELVSLRISPAAPAETLKFARTPRLKPPAA